VSLRFFITMYGLSSLNLMNCTCYVVISPSMQCALLEPHLMTVVDNELTIFSFSLVRLDKNSYGGGVLLYIRDDLSYNAMLMVPESMELPLHNCGSNHFCLCVLYSPTSLLTLFCNSYLFYAES